MIKKHSAVYILILCMCLLLGCSNGSTQEEVTATSNMNAKLTISGLEQGDIGVSVDEVMGMAPITAEATGVDSAGEETTSTVKGVLLSDILENNGVNQKDLFAIRLVAGDGYQIEVPGEILGTRDIIIAYEMDGQALDEKSKPFRAIIPDERAMYWVRNLVNIEILQGSKTVDVTSVAFMETALNQLPKEDYTYYESTDKAVKNTDILGQFRIDSSVETINFLASDGLEKNETINVFMNSYIKLTGEEAPVFLSPDMPKGMHIKNIFSFKAMNMAFVSLNNAEKICDKGMVGDKEGISVKAILDKLENFAEADTYILTGLDGIQVEVDYETLMSSVITKTSEGGFYITTNGSKNTSEKDIMLSVKDIMMIEVK